ncbi:MAG: FHA domain-containing protein [Thermoleophilia bacterium]
MRATDFAHRNQDEFRVLRDAEHTGDPFLLARDGDGRLRAFPLRDAARPLSAGRQEGCDVRLDWDERVSRIHATIEFEAGDWSVVDAGRSLNGTYVNGERVARRVRLRDRDVLRMGGVDLLFRRPRYATSAVTAGMTEDPRLAVLLGSLTARERAILDALCAPMDPVSGGSPAANSVIAQAVGIEVPNVKAALTVLFQKFGLANEEPSVKRQRLADLALRHGVAAPGRSGG